MRNLFLAVALSAALPTLAADGKALSDIDFFLTVLHFNDGESELLGEDGAGSISRFVWKMRQLGFEATNYSDLATSDYVVLSSGDNFLAGPEFNASLELPESAMLYDAQAAYQTQLMASAIGNHEFDFGPDLLARFIDSIPVPYVSANLDFSNEPALQALVDRGEIRRSTVLTRSGRKIGIVGATTPNLAEISSPRNTIVAQNVAELVQAEIDALTDAGVGIIILISHLQSINNDLELIPQLTGIDIAIAGGGDELLANPGNPVIPGDEDDVSGPYPTFTTDATGKNVPIVTTAGQYNYIGRLVTGFTADGELAFLDVIDSGPQRVVDPVVGPDGVEVFDSAFLPANVTIQAPVQASVEGIQANVIGTSQVGLNGVRGDVRTRETNLGNLIADSQLALARDLAADFGAPVPQVALQNGGGIRNDSIIPAGDITEFDTFSIVPFSNFVTVVPGVTRMNFKEILENAYSQIENVNGRFAQVAGFTVSVDLSGTPGVSRVTRVVLDDGSVVVDNGQVIAGPDLSVATIDFLARGGDGYPFPEGFTVLGVSYQQALLRFIQQDLGGVIPAAAYPEDGSGRIMIN